jgi:uncharacterized protein with FMN-binding domain
MRKFFASFAFLAAFGIYALYQNPSTGSVTATAPTPTVSEPVASTQDAQPTPTPTPAPTPSPTPTPTPAPKPTPTPTPAPAPVPPPKPKGQYVDGSYTGSAADAYYGYVQVQVAVSGGKITDVQFLQYPNDRNTSRYINSQAMPILKSEAIQAQSAQVDGVSGASDTSAAFQESLASALSQAKS